MADIDRKNEGPPAPPRGVSDEDIDRAVQGMIAATPSPRLRAGVMARLHEGGRVPAALRLPQWRMAFGTAALLVLAVVVWFGVRQSRPHDASMATADRPAGNAPLQPTGAPQPPTVPPQATALAQGSPAVSTPSTVERRTSGAPGSRPALPQGEEITARLASAPVPLALIASPPASESAAVETVDALPDIAPLEITPLPSPAPLVIVPVAVRPLDIPQLTIAPVPDPADRQVQPPGTGQADRRPGAAALPRM